MNARLRAWSRIAVPFVSVQSIIYLINAVSGWLLVRLLPPRELALFTSGFAAFTILNVIANGGVASAMTSQAAGVVHQPRELRSLIDVVQAWRFRLALLAALVALPMLVYSMNRLGYAPSAIAVGLVMALAYAGLNLLEQAWTVVLRIQGQYRQLQRIEAQNAVLRVVAIVALLTSWGSGLIALAITVAAEAVLLLQVHRAASTYVATQQGVLDFRRPVGHIVRHALPGVAFFAVQGQLSLWITMLLGSHLSIASMGALGRVGALYALLGPFFDNVVAPKYARLSGDRLSLVYWQLISAALVAATVLTVLLLACGELILAVLGQPYQGLRFELALVLATAGLGFIATVVGTLNKARSWVRGSWMLGPATIGVQLVAIVALPIATLRGALLLGLVSVVPGLVVGLCQALVGLRSHSPGLSSPATLAAER